MCRGNRASTPSTSSPLSAEPRECKHWSTDGSPHLHLVKIHGHNFRWLNYQKDVTSSLIGREEGEKKWSCLASVFVTAWMTCLHDSYLTASLLPACGCWWLEARGQIQEHPVNTEHPRDRRQSAGTALLQPDSGHRVAHSAAFTLLLTLKFCICSGQFWGTIPAPAKCRSWNQFGCKSLPDPA